MLVQVREHHIQKAIAGAWCPIIHAVLELIGGNASVIVTYSAGLLVAKNGQAQQYHLPKEALEFMHRFDAGERVEPLTFIAYTEEEIRNAK